MDMDISRNFLNASRLVLGPKSIVEVHGFCDASIEAYETCVYIVSMSEEATSHPLCSKSRRAPLKTFMLPKLSFRGLYEFRIADSMGNIYDEWFGSGLVLDQG